MLLCGCDDDSGLYQASKRRKKSKKKQASQEPAVVEIVKAKESFTYSPVGKRDPFRSYLADLSQAQTVVKKRNVAPTEEFEISQYRLVGVISGTSQPRALVEDPGARGHTLRIGSKLGKSGGRVTRISSAGIVVVEEYRAPTGERVRQTIVVDLPKEKATGLGPRSAR